MGNPVAISSSRTVPISEDLTTENNRLNILRGLEKMFRVDKKLASGSFDLLSGEWAVLKDDDTVERPSATPVANSYLVFLGTDRFDSHATGQVTLIMASDAIVKTTQYDAGPTYAVGDALTVKDLGGGEAFVTKAAGSDPIVARVHAIGDGTLTYELRNN